MKQVKIYTYSGIKGLKPQDGAAGYLLETDTPAGVKTLHKVLKIQNATANQSELIVLIEALKRMREACELTIFTESEYVAAGYRNGWVDMWLKSGWLTARGKEVANRAEWQELDELLSCHEFSFEVAKEHEYRVWLKSEVNTAKENDRYV